MPTVARLSVAPVKSTALHHPEEVRVEVFGVPENRRFYFVNVAGRLLGGARHGPLVSIRADYDPARERLSLRFPGGREVRGPVHLAAGEPRVTVFWGRLVEGHDVEGPFSDAVSEFVGEPVRLVRVHRPGDANDSHAVSIVSSASVRELARRAGRTEPLDPRRFRMLVEVEGTAPHEEDRWVGRDVRVGEAVVRVVRQDPRCVVTTQDPETGIPDFPTLKAIRAYRGEGDDGVPFGVYADVVRPGRVRVGDVVSPLR